MLASLRQEKKMNKQDYFKIYSNKLFQKIRTDLYTN